MTATRTTIELHGRVKVQRPAAVLFHVTFPQPEKVPDGAVGGRFWFPTALCRLRDGKDGRQVLTVPSALLERKVREAKKAPAPAPQRGWWMDKDPEEAA